MTGALLQAAWTAAVVGFGAFTLLCGAMAL